MNILNRSFAWLGKHTRDLLRNASYSVENLTVTHSVLSNHLMTREKKHGYALQLSEMSTIVIISLTMILASNLYSVVVGFVRL